MLKRPESSLREMPPARAASATGEAAPDRSDEAALSDGGKVDLRRGEEKIIEVFVQFANALGLPRSLAEIYGLLFATPRPLALQEIVDRLGISKGSASQGLRFLRTMGAVSPLAVEGDRREFFEPVVELRKLVAGFVRERLEPELHVWGQAAENLSLAEFGDRAQVPAQARILGERIRKFQKWQASANAILPKVSRLLG